MNDLCADIGYRSIYGYTTFKILFPFRNRSVQSSVSLSFCFGHYFYLSYELYLYSIYLYIRKHGNFEKAKNQVEIERFKKIIAKKSLQV